MKNKLAVFVAVALVAIGLLGMAGTLPARAAVGPADDRQMTTPTGWATYTGVTAAQVSNLVSANGARLTDIQVDNAATPTFTVVMVRNAGSYASGWWWYYGQTASQVSSQLAAHNARKP